MQLVRLFLIILLVGTYPACKESSFSGSGQSKQPVQKKSTADAKKPAQDTHKENDPLGKQKTDKNKNTDTDNEPLDDDILSAQPEPQQPQPNIPDLSTNAVNTTPPVTFPDDIVDGQEVLKTCTRCLERAKTLSASIGFVASMAKTYNLGFYKIDPSQNLCDIHFMNNLNTPIDDHFGKDSIGNNQVILYCPCNCSWASNSPQNQGNYP